MTKNRDELKKGDLIAGRFSLANNMQVQMCLIVPFFAYMLSLPGENKYSRV